MVTIMEAVDEEAAEDTPVEEEETICLLLV